jgi:hypothetical protein
MSAQTRVSESERQKLKYVYNSSHAINRASAIVTRMATEGFLRFCNCDEFKHSQNCDEI